MKPINSHKILAYLLFTGVIAVACTSPYFLPRVIKYMLKSRRYDFPNYKKMMNSFAYLKKKGFIMIERVGNDIKISLTEEGKKKVKKYQIDNLKIIKPKIWDKLWRVVIFDIPDAQKIKRNAFRRKLKELGFYSLQKSVWLHPFDCNKEIDFLREFFGLNKKQIEILLVNKIENVMVVDKIKSVYGL